MMRIVDVFQDLHVDDCVKIMIPFGVPSITRHLIFGVITQKGTIILTTAHMLRSVLGGSGLGGLQLQSSHISAQDLQNC